MAFVELDSFIYRVMCGEIGSVKSNVALFVDRELALLYCDTLKNYWRRRGLNVECEVDVVMFHEVKNMEVKRESRWSLEEWDILDKQADAFIKTKVIK